MKTTTKLGIAKWLIGLGISYPWLEKIYKFPLFSVTQIFAFIIFIGVLASIDFTFEELKKLVK